MAIDPKFFMIDKDGAVVIWRFYYPPKNIWTGETAQEFNDLVEEFYADPDLRVGIMTSAMPDVFVQHFDVSILVQMGEQLQKAPPPQPTERPKPRGIYRRGPKPVIAAINANLAGGGLELTMACDFRFMSRNASAAQSEVNVGILPGGGGTQRMPRLVGLPKALELMLTGRRVFADEAERIGLVTRACDPLTLMPETLAFAKALADRPPLAVQHIRTCVYQGWDMPLEKGLELEGQLFQELVKSKDALERMRAYVSSGQPGASARLAAERAEAERVWKERLAKKQQEKK
ncbi:MAG: enoyl-CoA hydratase/isomerase family protein [Dehalococcoidia bacterium]|nr:enoyl-CoA hydratase/isomerase family protein [Dehalococcoidia bacterium]